METGAMIIRILLVKKLKHGKMMQFTQHLFLDGLRPEFTFMIVLCSKLV